MTEKKRFTIEECRVLSPKQVLKILNKLQDEKKELIESLVVAKASLTNFNELQKENEQLKRTISKIDFAIIRKYDNSLENLLDEVYDGEYNKWIKKQLSRAKKLDGDVE